MADDKGAILVRNVKGQTIKWFKTWHKGEKKDKAKIEITYKKNGEKKKLVKVYEGDKVTVALNKCVDAVIKYWPKYDPDAHHIVMSAGHFHTTVKIKKKKGKKK